MTAPTDIAARIAAIRERIEHSCERAGRSPEEVTLLAVSKRKSTANIETAIEAGQLDFAENYIQEARDKRPEIHVAAEGIRWHFIGHLQSNKAKEAVRLFDVIHTVDRPKLARELEKHAAALEKTLRIYLQVNLSQEEQKSGVNETNLPALLTACAELPHIQVEGLMTIPALAEDAETTRPVFRRLGELRDELQQSPGGVELRGLSMGMSGDFETAIEEGATIVRIGTAIFGPREKQR